MIGPRSSREKHVRGGCGNETGIGAGEIRGPVAQARTVGHSPDVGVTGEATLPIGIGQGGGRSHVELHRGVAGGDAGDGEVSHVVEVADQVRAAAGGQAAAGGTQDVRQSGVGDDTGQEVGIHRDRTGDKGQRTAVQNDPAAGIEVPGSGHRADLDTEAAAGGKFEDRAAGAREGEGAADGVGDEVEGGSAGHGELGGAGDATHDPAARRPEDMGKGQDPATHGRFTDEGVGVAQDEGLTTCLDEVEVVLDHPAVGTEGGRIHREGAGHRAAVGDETCAAGKGLTGDERRVQVADAGVEATQIEHTPGGGRQIRSGRQSGSGTETEEAVGDVGGTQVGVRPGEDDGVSTLLGQAAGTRDVALDLKDDAASCFREGTVVVHVGLAGTGIVVGRPSVIRAVRAIGERILTDKGVAGEDKVHPGPQGAEDGA